MTVSTRKFSEFSDGGAIQSTDKPVGLRSSENTMFSENLTGIATLISGTVVVLTALISSDSNIQLTAQDNNTIGALRVSSRSIGVSFTITSSNSGDSGVVGYAFQ